MMRALLVAVAWADIILCAMARVLVLLMPALAMALTVAAIWKRGRR